MKFRKGNIGATGTYYCTKHRKYSITVTELHQLILDSIKLSVSRISLLKLEKMTLKAINGKNKEYKNSLQAFERQLEKLCMKASLTYNPDDDLEMIQKHFQQINELKGNIAHIDNVITQLDLLKEEINLLVELTRKKLHSLKESEAMIIAELLIENIQLHEDFVVFNYYFNDFFKEDAQDAS